MERDFLGLSSREPLAVVKEEVNADGCKESGSGMQWPFSNKVSTPRHSTAEFQMFPVSNHAIPISMGNHFFKNHYPATGQNMAGTTTKPQLLGGIPVTAPHSILPMVGSVAGVTDSSVKASGSPAQLTIFYAGSVNVYDDISPEKAQAIMFLAGNGSSISSNLAQPIVQVQASISKPAAADLSPVNQPIMSTPPCSRLSSPSHTGAQSGSGSTSTEEIMATKTTGAVTTHVTKPEHPKTANVVGSVTTTTMIPSVPQARKASLARFLEKRKERVMNAAPYNLNKKSPHFTNPEPY
ncbi:protein TIFY 6B-like isoform X3 [Populus nigra]|uniref:protein TIFY 6B-like isoform X3 n=1 Tax=Populus nigra TaxID=3691 RepID=UPI002B276FB4|nr:protein TIFY 6B-like isoform X3 [Populus nigra]